MLDCRILVFLLVISMGCQSALADPVSPAAMSEDKIATIDFNRDIRGILSDACFLCHGPDDSTREAGLRLDVREEALATGAIIPGNASASELIRRITSDDPDLVMPPPHTGKPINQHQRDALARWIDEGARYAEHWAFVAPQRPESLSQTNATDRTPLDAFVDSKLNAQNIVATPPADISTLVRRLHLDLTGLPPSIETLNRFNQHLPVAAQRDRIDALIEECLKTPQFGERWARWWLDAARYADSAGYEKDMPRQVYFYRDWVINAMNRDMPYDDFIIDQIAGDLRPGAGQAERVATGFLRQSMTNEEGGADPEQFRVEAMFDRMDAIGKAVLGITTQCAQCHTHKYDPLSHREYYQMFAAINDFHEACMTVYTPEQATARRQILDRVAQVEARLKGECDDWRDSVARWAHDVADDRPSWTALTPTEVPYEGQKFRILDDGSILSESYAPTKCENRFSLTTDLTTITAVRLDALTHPQLPRGGPGRSVDGTGALSEFAMTVTPLDASDQPGKPIKVSFRRAISDVEPPSGRLKPQYRNRDPAQDDRLVGSPSYAIDGDIKTAWTTDIGPGRSNQDRHVLLIPEKPIVVNSRAIVQFTLTQKHGGWNADDNQNFLLGRYRLSITDSGEIPQTTIDSLIESFIDGNVNDWSEEQWNLAFAQFRQTRPEWSHANQTIESLWQSHPETDTQLVVQARRQPLPTYVLARGDFLAPGDQVQADAPAFLHAMESIEGVPDRLRFARWLVHRDSPTTARVIVNRIWQAYFGRGLVKTPEDFGFQSEPPSHPKLLDYLAVELMDSGWSLKHVHRLIVRSATYQRASIASTAAYLDDPDNTYLARGPRFRLDAEMVRDSALLASGLLNPTVGGPSVYPPAPDFLFLPPTSYGPKVWESDQSGHEYRRSLYVHQYRSIPYPPLQVFDAPKGDAACVRRQRSNTPLQALVMLNEPQFVEAARAMAARVMRAIPPTSNDSDNACDHRRIRYAFRLCTSRFPDADECSILQTRLNQARQEWTPPLRKQDVRSQDRSLEQVLGTSPRVLRQVAGLDARELAAWMTVCRVILNLDETITKS
ncbi:MAG: PSD1 and planctomycete cytochrome C domain-containing protein [Planctomycetota bacterium]